MKAPVTDEGPPDMEEEYDDVYGIDPETGERVGFESYDLDKFDETVEHHNFAYGDVDEAVVEEDTEAVDADDESEVKAGSSN